MPLRHPQGAPHTLQHSPAKAPPTATFPQTHSSRVSFRFLSLQRHTLFSLSLRFGGAGFYTYHVLFTSQASGRLHQFNQRTQWGALDSELYRRVFVARPSLPCNLCGALSHPATKSVITVHFHVLLPRPHAPASPLTTACCTTFSHHPQPTNSLPSTHGTLPCGIDKRGRLVLFQGGRMVCNNFNNLGCNLSSCWFLQTCSFCGSAHARSTP